MCVVQKIRETIFFFNEIKNYNIGRRLEKVIIFIEKVCKYKCVQIHGIKDYSIEREDENVNRKNKE